MSKIYMRGFSREADMLWQYLLNFEIPRSINENLFFFESEAKIGEFDNLK